MPYCVTGAGGGGLGDGLGVGVGVLRGGVGDECIALWLEMKVSCLKDLRLFRLYIQKLDRWFVLPLSLVDAKRD